MFHLFHPLESRPKRSPEHYSMSVFEIRASRYARIHTVPAVLAIRDSMVSQIELSLHNILDIYVLHSA
jgi:hypothetical protein